MEYLKEVERHLDLSPADKAEVLKELTAHYDELKEELTASGLDKNQIEEEANRRLGKPHEIAGRLCAVHCSASWKTTLLCAAPFIISIITWLLISFKLRSAGIVVAVCTGLLFSTVSAREFLQDRRPVWLATWWAGTLMLAMTIISIGVVSFKWYGYYSLAIGIGILAIVTAWRTRCSVIATTLACIFCCYVCVYILQNTLIPGIRVTLFNTFILILLAPFIRSVIFVLYSKLVFQNHRFGSGTQASLFMFSLAALSYMPYSGTHNGAMTNLDTTICQIMCVISVICYVRLPQRRFKTMALLTGITALVIRNLAGLIVLHIPLVDMMVYTVITTTNHLFILIPILSERIKLPNRRQLA